MEKVTKIPNLFGIDGYALPEEFRKYKESEQENTEEDFGKILDFEMGRLKHGKKNRRGGGDPVLHRRKP